MRRVLLALACCFVGPIACGTEPPPPQPVATDLDAAKSSVPLPSEASVRAHPNLNGTWRATLASTGGELPFRLELRSSADGTLGATIVNGPERLEPSRVAWDGDELVIAFDVYDSEIRARGDADALSGTWVHTMPFGQESMRFSAIRDAGPRFVGDVEPPAHEVPASIDGNWAATFTEPDGSTFAAQAVITSRGDRLEATFLTDTGDFRYLDGRYVQGRLELSCFDGAHAFLLRADVGTDGALAGDLWAMSRIHFTWRATPMADGDPSPLADPSTIVGLTPEADGRMQFAFPDLTGTMVRHDDPRFDGKVVLVELFGTWCPNCNDYAPLLESWHERYGPRGLEIVGLAFEMTGDPQRDRTFVQRFAERHGIAFPLLLAGESDKAKAALNIPAITKVEAYPTTILIDRHGKVRHTHSGFAGPATGSHHTELRTALERRIEALLAEAAPQ
ncbi:TlpA family protein disulfide reductase [Paraliomyxa miuraensis]|uniref:TlpA family protein disulfide reductase n=1 Tax=Paraliomyxa miuraensis TaxID=376150 RepID=UPI00225A0274|nr:TlpA disulfide reductase family protein [Paraliomyxa miuraensis]MCX4245599.1 TlpA family protein disulfide reductase [Paraliomyxa miuraensis]